MFHQNSTHKSLYFFYLLVITGLIAVLYTTPFLRFPYDPIAHLIAIDEIYHGAKTTSTSLQSGRLLWHSTWANIFHIFDIRSIDFLLRAKIIHITQTFIALFSIYYFSHVIIRNLFYNISVVTLKYLSLWSVIIWLTVFATFSIVYHNVWNIWYSLTYQVTLPLFWYITALTLALFLEEVSKSKKIFFILQILLISVFILKAHSMELMYYFMYIVVFALIYVEKTYSFIRKYCCAFVLSIATGVLLISKNLHDDTNFFYFLSKAIDKGDPVYLYRKIMAAGEVVTEHYNRSSYAINEMVYFLFYFAIIVLIYFIWNNIRRNAQINSRLFIFILLTSLFILIPVYLFPAGLFALITREHVVHRLYFSSSLFVLLPIFVYYILHRYTVKLRYINTLLLISILSVFYYSKHNDTLAHNYYKNLRSLEYSFNKSEIGVNLSKEQIKHIGKQMAHYEKINPTSKEIQYFARNDIAFVLKYIYGKKVYYPGWHKDYNHSKAYWNHYKEYPQYHNIIYRTHGTFPKNSDFIKKVYFGFNFTQEQIDAIGKKIAYYEKINPTSKEILYFARHDIAFVLKYIYGKKVYWKGRRKNVDHNKAYLDHHKRYSTSYHSVLFHTSTKFPPYKPYK